MLRFLMEIKRWLFIGILITLIFGAIGSYSGAMAEYTSTESDERTFSSEELEGITIPLFARTISLATDQNDFRNFRRALKYVFFGAFGYTIVVLMKTIIDNNSTVKKGFEDSAKGVTENHI